MLIDYKNDLNPAQYEAATTLEGAVLVIAGAGSGKTRTIVYRLARLIESGVPASSILLLTFTRKAAHEMLERAKRLMQQQGMPSLSEHPNHQPAAAHTGLAGVQGGTFHSYAYSVLRIFQPHGMLQTLTVMDSHDITSALQHCREELKVGKGDRSFPKNQTIHGLLSKSRNKELSLDEVIRRDANHLTPHVDAIEQMGTAYTSFKASKGLLDYDDLLFEFERLLRERPEALAYCQRKHQYIMLDEYQDTNPVQARIAGLVAGIYNKEILEQAGDEAQHINLSASGNIMVVGDDAQSIYAFRGANVRNILEFPQLFPNTKIIRLEENYRSTQPILDLTNAILENAAEGFKKHLFTRRVGATKPCAIRPLSDRSQASIITSRIIELQRVYPPNEIAILFRSGYHSYPVEVQLNKLGIKFRKYGGIRYTEAAHVKDAMCYIRLVQNPLDFTAFVRMAEMSKGVGAKTCLKIFELMLAGNSPALIKAIAKFSDLQADLSFIDLHRKIDSTPSKLLSDVIEHYQPRLELMYPDDFPKRLQGLEQLVQIASSYTDLDLFIADLSLDDPMAEEDTNDSLVLSTIHSAKGLEWSAVQIIDLVEERFPSRHSLSRPEDFEEERRLMYVACTRAKEHLELYVPATLYDRGSGGSIPAVPSPFIRELSSNLYEEYQESYAGGLIAKASIGKGQTTTTGHSASAHGSASAGTKSQAQSSSPWSTTNSAPRPLQTVRHSAPPPDDDHAPSGPTPAELSRAIGSGTAPSAKPEQCGYCQHKIFGRGKIIQHISPDKYKVNFPGIGLKVIMAAYLTLED